jgi:ATP-dependent helicase/nuclease subunit B
MDILDLFAVRVEEVAHDPKRLSELLKLAVEAVHIARPPETLDQVLIGQADRVRPDTPRAAFVIGAVESEFPKTEYGGRAVIRRRPQKVVGWRRTDDMGRRPFIGPGAVVWYNALTAASRRVLYFLSPALRRGGPLLPSVLFTQAKAMFPTPSFAGYIPPDTVFNLLTAADALSDCWHDNTPRRASLETLLRQNGGGALVERIRSAAQKPVHQIKDKAVSLAVFAGICACLPRASRRYYSCPFSFLMSGPLGIRARRKAEPSALEAGSLIHWILETHADVAGVDPLKMERAELRGQIRDGIESYVSARAVDGAVLGKRSAYLFDRLADPIEALLLRIGRNWARVFLSRLILRCPYKPAPGSNR